MAYISIFDYLAHGRDDTKTAVVDLMRKQGYTINPRNEAELAECIKRFAAHMGVEQAMPLLATIHPDRDLILDSIQPATMGADGTFSVADNQQPATGNQQPINPYPENNSSPTNHLIIAGIIGIALIGMVGVIVKS